MINQQAAHWLNTHWSREYLEDNSWVAVSSDGLISSSPDLDEVMEASSSYELENIVFTYVSFGVWQ
jgi:hypothetical protein